MIRVEEIERVEKIVEKINKTWTKAVFIILLFVFIMMEAFVFTFKKIVKPDADILDILTLLDYMYISLMIISVLASLLLGRIIYKISVEEIKSVGEGGE